MTEEELSKSHWWWNRTRFLFPRSAYDPNPHEWRQWKDGLQQTAFEYELVRRVCKARQLPIFVELDGGIQHQLHYRLCPPRKKFTRKITTESFPHGWSKPNADDWQFNLEATDNQLLESLKGSVNEIVMFAKLTGPQRLENVTISLTDPFTPPTKLCGLPEGGLLEELAFHVGVATHFRSAK